MSSYRPPLFVIEIDGSWFVETTNTNDSYWTNTMSEASKVDLVSARNYVRDWAKHKAKAILAN